MKSPGARRALIILTLASLVAFCSAPTVAQSGAEAQWQFYGPASQSVEQGSRAQAVLIHGIPETDASNLVIRCYQGDRKAEIAFQASALRIGAQEVVPIKISVGEWQAVMTAKPAASDLVAGEAAPAVVLPTSSPFWRAFSTAQNFDAVIGTGREELSVPLVGLDFYVPAFLEVCESNAATATTSPSTAVNAAPTTIAPPPPPGDTVSLDKLETRAPADSRAAARPGADARTGLLTGKTGICRNGAPSSGSERWSSLVHDNGVTASVAECADCEMGMAMMCLRDERSPRLIVPWAAVDQLGADTPARLEICIDGESAEYTAGIEYQGMIGHMPFMDIRREDEIFSKLASGKAASVHFKGRWTHFSLKNSRRSIEAFLENCDF